jgi:N4-(beta-N-acetylglucosaminyl)-L-asparaginase
MKDEKSYSLDRRQFLSSSALVAAGLLLTQSACGENEPAATGNGAALAVPLVVSTWAPNVKANAAAWKVLEAGGSALDAVEQGVFIPEADPEDSSVGLGGLPDRDGRVTLDACIMDHKGHCGAVLALENILHPISVARMVMEKTAHVMLAGAGALKFALENGFEAVDLLTPGSEKAWIEWLEDSEYDPSITPEKIMQRIKESHDTIGMLAMDKNSDISGACSTSGMAFKLAGRVGDSPIIGAGLYVDNEVGAATGTGVGEEVVRICGAHTIVEQMRAGKSPDEACKEAISRIIKHNGDKANRLQVGFIAINKAGRIGAYSTLPEFSYAVQQEGKEPEVFKSDSWFDKWPED